MAIQKPSQFLKQWRTQAVNLQDIQKLLHSLEAQQANFNIKFVKKGGAMALFSMMAGSAKKKYALVVL